eukprot:3617028-Rhodomonas_salina.1
MNVMDKIESLKNRSLRTAKSDARNHFPNTDCTENSVLVASKAYGVLCLRRPGRCCEMRMVERAYRVHWHTCCAVCGAEVGCGATEWRV